MTEEENRASEQEPEGGAEGVQGPPAAEDLQRRIAEMEESIAASESDVAALRESLTGAVLKYRTAVLEAAPGVPEELVTGETVDEIDASLSRARDMVSRVKQELEARTAAESVPTGSPPRQALDPATLSPAAKIQHALNQERR